jgi:glycosyltransferase involved in cell wall biosynthesis
VGVARGKPIRLLELRSVWGAGGGPEKTILLSAARHDPSRVRATVAYLRSPRDLAFAGGVRARAREAGVSIVEVDDRVRFDLGCISRLRQLALDADVIHAHDYKTDVYGLALARRGGARLVATAHGWTGENRKVRLYQKIDLIALRRYERVLAVSRPTHDVLVTGGVDPKKVVIVPNAIDEAVWRPDNEAGDLRSELGLGPDDPVIGTTARLSIEKGVDLLLSAVARANDLLAARGARLPVVLVAGDGPERAELEWLARLKGLGPHVRFLGHRGDPMRVANTFTVAVVPSRVENLPNALLEAMALGKACVAFGVGGVPDLLGSAGRLVAPLDVEGLGRAIVDLLVNPPLRDRLGVEARRRIVRQFSFAERLRRVEDIYEEVCAQPKAPPRISSKWTWPWFRRATTPRPQT